MSNKYDKIVEKYPLLFQSDTDTQTPFKLFGFECNEGWYDIIENMCRCMYSEHRSAKYMLDHTLDRLAQFPGREDLLELQEQYTKALNKAIKRLPKIAQIKEKFGTLRVYLDGGCGTAHGIAEMAEAMSEVTCEICGNKGHTYTMGWHKTLCYEHAIERYTKDAVDEYNLEQE